MSASSTTLVAGKVHAVGDLVEVDGRISWFAPGARGLAPVNSYVLIEDDDALLIDTGVPVHEQAIVEQLRRLLPASASVGILHTRIVEYDSSGNTATLVRELPVDRIYSHFEAQGWVHYRPKHDLPGVAPAQLWPVDRSIEFPVPMPGETLSVGRSGSRVIDVIGAPLRVLATYWLYDRETRILFTSDTFGHALMHDRDDARVVDGDADHTTFDQVYDHLLGKFDWLADADTSPLRAELRRIFETYDIETIAPGFGRALRGRDVVARHYELVDRALGEAGAARLSRARRKADTRERREGRTVAAER